MRIDIPPYLYLLFPTKCKIPPYIIKSVFPAEKLILK